MRLGRFDRHPSGQADRRGRKRFCPSMPERDRYDDVSLADWPDAP